MRYVLNDERIKTSHGFYLLNDGGIFDRFDENPVMLLQHNENDVVGKWENRRIEGHELLADPVFYEGCEGVKDKVGKGYLRGLSIALYILEAKKRAGELYVTKWEMVECSVVSIPSNKKALISLKVLDANNIEVKNVKKFIKLSIKKNMEINLSSTQLVELSLEEGFSEDQLENSISLLLKTKETLKAENTALKAQLEKINLKKVEDLTEIIKNKVPADKLDSFVNLAKSDYDTAIAIVSCFPERVTLADKIKAAGKESERTDWTFFDWKNKDPEGLAQLKINENETYNKIIKKLK